MLLLNCRFHHLNGNGLDLSLTNMPKTTTRAREVFLFGPPFIWKDARRAAIFPPQGTSPKAHRTRGRIQQIQRFSFHELCGASPAPVY